MFPRRVSPHPAEWDLIVELRNGRALLAGDTVEVFLHDDGTVTAWRGVGDYCHTRDPATACQLIDVALAQQVPVRSCGRPTATDTKGIIRG